MSEVNKIRCPVCGSNDQIQSVVSVTSQGTSTGFGYAATNMLFLQPGHTPGFGVGGTAFASRSTSGLAQRLLPHARPDSPHWASIASTLGFALTFVLAFNAAEGNPLNLRIVVLSMDLADLSPTSPGRGLAYWMSVGFAFALFIIPSLLAGAIISPFIVSIVRWYLKPQMNIWDENYSHYIKSYYCFRDDTLFTDEIWGKPADFLHEVFVKRRPPLSKKKSELYWWPNKSIDLSKTRSWLQNLVEKSKSPDANKYFWGVYLKISALIILGLFIVLLISEILGWE